MRIAPALLLVGAVLTVACSGGPPPPTVELSALSDDVRTMIEERIAAVDGARREAGPRAALGLALEANALPEPAAEAFAQAIELQPSEARWHYHHARVLAALDRADEALAALDTAILAAPGYGPARRTRGEWLLASGRLDEADTTFRGGVKVAPNDIGMRCGLVRVALQRGDHETALAILDPLVERDPGAGYLRRLAADAHRAAGDLERAQAELALAGDAVLPSWPDPWTEELDRFRIGYAAELKRAMRLVAAKEFDRAIPMLESLRSRQPDDVTLLTNLGAAYVDTRRVPEGVAALREALRHDPEHFGAHLNLAAAFERGGRPDEALEHVDRAIASNPALSDAHVLRGRLLVGRRRLDEALEAFDRASRADPRQILPRIFAGWVRAERSEWPAALDAFRDAVAIDLDDGRAQLGLALALAETGDLDGARAALRIAERRAPNEPQLPIVRRRLAELGG